MKTLYFQTKVSLVLIICALFMTRCQQEEAQEPVPVIEQEIFSSEAKDEMIVDLAKTLASSMEDVEVKSFLKESVLKKFDGDYDIFFHKAKDAPLSISDKQGRVKTTSFAEVLFGDDKSSTVRNGEQGSLQKYLSDLQQAHPLLQIAIPDLPGASAETWDVSKHTPLVVYLSSEYDEKTTKFVKAYDSNGNVHMVDAVNPPNELLVVISQNERLMAIDKDEFDKKFSRINARCPIERYYEAENNVYVLKEDYYNSECGGGYPPVVGNPPPSGGGSSSCDREGNSKYDNIRRIKFTSMDYFRAAESYVMGAPELFLTVFTGSTNTNLAQLTKWIPKVDRSKWKDCGVFTCDPEWHDLTLEVLYWDKDEFGDTMKYQWFEHDSGDPVEFSSSITTKFDDGTTNTNQIKTTITQKDTNLGESFVRHCESASKDYSTGKIYFGLKLLY